MGALGSFPTLQCKLGVEVGQGGGVGGESFSNSPPLGGSRKALALGNRVALQSSYTLGLGREGSRHQTSRLERGNVGRRQGRAASLPAPPPSQTPQLSPQKTIVIAVDLAAKP